MNQDSLRLWQASLAGLTRWLIFFAVIWLLGSVGLGWLIDSFLILLGLLIVVPVIAFFGLQWWIKRNLVQDACPVCGFGLTGLNGAELACPSCGEPIKVEAGRFTRLTPPGTVDVSAVEVKVAEVEVLD